MRAMQWASRLAEFCYPSACRLCRRSSDAGAFLCGACEAELAALEARPGCDACGMPLATAGDPCPYCEGRGVYPLETIIRLGIFESPLKDLIHILKYQSQWTIAEFFAERLVRRPRIRAMLDECDVVAPVPLHVMRHILRGYNQADVLARRLVRLHRGGGGAIRLEHPLVRLRPTETQTHLHSREARQANVHDAFGVLRPSGIQRKHVCVIDDVMTTGATLKEVGRALLAAGAQRVSAIIVAVADPKGRGFEAI